MVQVDAVVRDRAGRLIDNLTADDFRVYEDGVLQEIQSFSRDELPLAVALVIDRSGSVGPYISELRRIATRALDQLKPQDEVCLFSFADTVDRLEDLTTDRQRIVDAIDRIRTGGGTDITDALHDSVTYLARIAPGHRHAIILISDNQQTVNPQASETETIRTAMETETVVYSLKTSGDSLQLASQLPSLILRGNPVSKITQETGGEIISVNGVSSLDSALGSVISRLRMRYSLGYYPSGTAQGGAFHAITVRLTDTSCPGGYLLGFTQARFSLQHFGRFVQAAAQRVGDVDDHGHGDRSSGDGQEGQEQGIGDHGRGRYQVGQETLQDDHGHDQGKNTRDRRADVESPQTRRKGKLSGPAAAAMAEPRRTKAMAVVAAIGTEVPLYMRGEP